MTYIYLNTHKKHSSIVEYYRQEDYIFVINEKTHIKPRYQVEIGDTNIELEYITHDKPGLGKTSFNLTLPINLLDAIIPNNISIADLISVSSEVWTIIKISWLYTIDQLTIGVNLVGGWFTDSCMGSICYGGICDYVFIGDTEYNITVYDSKRNKIICIGVTKILDNYKPEFNNVDIFSYIKNYGDAISDYDMNHIRLHVSIQKILARLINKITFLLQPKPNNPLFSMIREYHWDYVEDESVDDVEVEF